MSHYSPPSDISQWDRLTIPFPANQDERDRQRLEIWSRWQYMSPFFSSHGLHLYKYAPPTDAAHPPALPKSAHTSTMPWPLARRAYSQEEDLDFSFLMTTRVWPARDVNGHEVMIRLASSGPSPSEELKIFQRLNTPEARNDPRNITLPILNYIVYDTLTFVIMPRWDTMAHSPWAPASTVSELLNLAETFFKGLEFLHEHRIAHRDIHTSNTVMNVLATPGKDLYNLRSPDAVRYAYIDYDASIAFPEDTDIDSLRITRLMRNPVRDMGLKPGMCSPFKDDVICLTWVAQTMVRVIDNVVPEIGAFFDSILRSSYEEVPSATALLKSFRIFREKVSNNQLKQPPGGRFWKRYTRK